MNKVLLTGRLGKDLELRKTQKGDSFTFASVACKRGTEVDFISCSVWGQAADFLTQYAHKGDVVTLEGELRTQTKEENGQKKTILGVSVYKAELFGAKREEKKEEKRETEQTPPTFTLEDISKEELPFY